MMSVMNCSKVNNKCKAVITGPKLQQKSQTSACFGEARMWCNENIKHASTGTQEGTIDVGLSTRPARSSPSCPWLTDVIREERSTLRAAERRWRKSKDGLDLDMYHSLLKSFSARITGAKTHYFRNKPFSTFSTLLNPPPQKLPSCQ